MGFKAYRITATGSGEWLIDQPLPLRFSGPNGLVARWCREHHGEVGDRLWMVEDRHWLALALGAVVAGNRWIIFEQPGDDGLRLARLERVSGRFGRETRMGFHFSPLMAAKPARLPAAVSVPENTCYWSEELALDGGPETEDCTWHWRAPQLALSSAIAGGARVATEPVG